MPDPSRRRPGGQPPGVAHHEPPASAPSLRAYRARDTGAAGELAAHAIDRVHRDSTGGRLNACPRVRAGAPVGIVCAQHPAGGLRCHTCAGGHIDRHDQIAEHRCDRCGTVDPGICGGFLAIRVELNVAGPRAAARPWHGTLVVGGFGLCTACTAQLDPVVAHLAGAASHPPRGRSRG